MIKDLNSKITEIKKIERIGVQLTFQTSFGPMKLIPGQKLLLYLPSKGDEYVLVSYIFKISSDKCQFAILLIEAFLSDEEIVLIQKLKIQDLIKHSRPQGKFNYIPYHYNGSLNFIALDQGIVPLLALLSDGRFDLKISTFVWFQSINSFKEGNLEEFFKIFDRKKEQFQKIKYLRYTDVDKFTEELEVQAVKRKGPFYLAGDGLIMAKAKAKIIMKGIYDGHILIEATHNKPPTIKIDKSALREGYTTGACSAAASKAATLIALSGKKVLAIKSKLPMGKEVEFSLFKSHFNDRYSEVSIIKDAGDDPDVTHGAEIKAKVVFTDTPGIVLINGVGVATVSKPGLGLTVGGPAINPVPRKFIISEVKEVLTKFQYTKGLEITISIEDGIDRAKGTINERLGLLGGLSILGTSGIVKPYSTAAFVASVSQSIKLAAHENQKELVFTTGGRSEQFAMKLLPQLTNSCFIQVGDYIGVALRNSVACKIEVVYIVAMIGKLSKMADGKMMTHASGSEVNLNLLSELAKSISASEKTVSAIKKANTARHVLDLCEEDGVSRKMCDLICNKVVTITQKFVRQKLECRVTMVDFVGRVIGKSKSS